MVTALETESKSAVTAEQVKWRCRRGMLELDLIFQKFFDSCYAQLSPSKRAAFIDMLNEHDQTLQRWLLGDELPARSDWQDLVLVIKYIAAQ